MSPVYPLGYPSGADKRDSCSAMTRRLITAVAVSDGLRGGDGLRRRDLIPPDHYPPTCEPDGLALQGDAADDEMGERDSAARPVLRRARHGHHPRIWGS